jgi:hypothetical protein
VTSRVEFLTFKQYASLVPFGLRTSMLVALIPLQTASLEHAKAAIAGAYLVLVVPLKFLKTTSEIVNRDGYSKQSVRFF